MFLKEADSKNIAQMTYIRDQGQEEFYLLAHICSINMELGIEARPMLQVLNICQPGASQELKC